MKIKSLYVDSAWRDAPPELDANGRPSPGRTEVRRVLSDLLRCNNLIVLTGLGTSLCVLDDLDSPKAPTMGALWTKVRETFIHVREDALQAGEQDFNSVLTLVRHIEGDGEDLEKLLSRCRLAEQFLDGNEKALVEQFIVEAEKCIARAVDFLEADEALPQHEQFLQRVGRRGARKSRAKIFTTNYDLCFEHAAQAGRFAVIDGFSPTQPAQFDPVYFTYDFVRREPNSERSDFIPNVFHLYKVHGSIDWSRDPISGVIYKRPKTGTPLLIYPRYNKYELAFAQPYLEMMSALQAGLREPNTGLLVIGFGFRDNHISEPILSAIRSNLSLKCAVVSPFLDDYGNPRREGQERSNPFLREIGQLISRGDARLALIDAKFEEVVSELPDLTSETDMEQHMERLRTRGAAP